MDASAAFRTLRIIHYVICGTVLVYGLVVYIMISQAIIPEHGFASDPQSDTVVRASLWLVATGCFLTIRVIRARFLTVEALRRHAARVVRVIIRWHIILYALAHAIATYGLVLFLMGAFLGDFMVLAGASLLIFYWLRPREDDYHALVREVIRT